VATTSALKASAQPYLYESLCNRRFSTDNNGGAKRCVKTLVAVNSAL